MTSQVNSRPNGVVVHREIVADAANQDLTAVHTNTGLYLDAVCAPTFLRDALHLLLQSERCVAGSDGMILVGNGCPKKGHDPVALNLVDRTFVLVHGIDHALERGLEKLRRIFRVQILGDLGRSTDICEKHCDPLTLTF